MKPDLGGLPPQGSQQASPSPRGRTNQVSERVPPGIRATDRGVEVRSGDSAGVLLLAALRCRHPLAEKTSATVQGNEGEDAS